MRDWWPVFTFLAVVSVLAAILVGVSGAVRRFDEGRDSGVLWQLWRLQATLDATLRAVWIIGLLIVASLMFICLCLTGLAPGKGGRDAVADLPEVPGKG